MQMPPRHLEKWKDADHPENPADEFYKKGRFFPALQAGILKVVRVVKRLYRFSLRIFLAGVLGFSSPRKL